MSRRISWEAELAGQGEPMTRDALFGGAVVLWQPARRHGYRFNLDPVLLADFAPVAEHAIDLGAGCGVLGLCMLALGRIQRLTAVEIQAELVEAARRNIEANRASAVAQIVSGDLRSVVLPAADLVVFNPPYFRAGEGAIPPDPGRHAARHEVYGTLRDFVTAAAGCAVEGGAAAAIVPAAREVELDNLLTEYGLAVVRRRHVVPRPGHRPGHVMLCARVGLTSACIDEAPLVVHEAQGRAYGPEVQQLLRERGRP